MSVQHEERRYGVQQCQYTGNTVPVRDRTKFTVEYEDVQHERADAGGVQQDVIRSMVHECAHSYNSTTPRCTRSYSTKECMQVQVRTT